MLKENRHVRQEPAAAGYRRWFEDDTIELELIVWHDARERVEGFQICYDFGKGEHALTWRPATGFAHCTVDSGSASPLRNETPVLVADGMVPWPELQTKFRERSEKLDPNVRALVLAKLMGEQDNPNPGAGNN